MDVDIGNALASVADPGVSRSALDALDDRVAAAHDRIEAGRADDEHGYAALNLPEQTDPDEVRGVVEQLDAGAGVDEVDAVITIGIGGSALGAKTVVDALGSDVETVFLDNVDPAWVESTLASLPLERSAISVVSRSGTTAETLANFLVTREAFEAAGVDWTNRTIVTTGESGPLRNLANRHDLPSLAVPDGVPGRYSALSAMGLIPAAIGGVNLDGVLAGARAEMYTLSGSLFECPAYAYGATAYALRERGVAANVMMPYAEALETYAEWFAQLWAESLGKDGRGQLPVRALGVTDQHSQLQLYRAGPPNVAVTFVDVRERPRVSVPETGIEELTYLEDTTLGDVIDAEGRATEASLAAANRPSIRVELDRLDAHDVGGLLYGMEAACVLAAELFDVNAFDQPAVEWGKRAARGLLGGDDGAAEAATVEGKTSLWVERE